MNIVEHELLLAIR